MSTKEKTDTAETKPLRKKSNAQTSAGALLGLAVMLLLPALVSPGGGFAFGVLAALCALPALILGPNIQRGAALLILIPALISAKNNYPLHSAYMQRAKVRSALESLDKLSQAAEAWHAAQGRWPRVAELKTAPLDRYVQSFALAASSLDETAVYIANLRADTGFQKGAGLRLSYRPADKTWSGNL